MTMLSVEGQSRDLMSLDVICRRCLDRWPRRQRLVVVVVVLLLLLLVEFCRRDTSLLSFFFIRNLSFPLFSVPSFPCPFLSSPPVFSYTPLSFRPPFSLFTLFFSHIFPFSLPISPYSFSHTYSRSFVAASRRWLGVLASLRRHAVREMRTIVTEVAWSVCVCLSVSLSDYKLC